MTRIGLYLPSFLLAIGATLAPSRAAAQSASRESAVPISPTLKVFDASYIDTSANACQDFFAFANGAWIKRDTIPAAFSSSGVGKDMTDRNELVVRSGRSDGSFGCTDSTHLVTRSDCLFGGAAPRLAIVTW